MLAEAARGSSHLESFQDLDQLLVPDLPKIAVVVAERAKYFVMFEADHIVGLGTQFGEAVRGGNGHREHEPQRMAQARRAQCGPGRCAGRDTVVDHDSRASGDFGGFAVAQIEFPPPLDLGQLGIARTA